MNYDDLSFWIMFAVSGFLMILCGFLLYQLESKEKELKQNTVERESYIDLAKKTDELLFQKQVLKEKLNRASMYLSKSVSVRIMNKDIRNDIREFLKGL